MTAHSKTWIHERPLIPAGSGTHFTLGGDGETGPVTNEDSVRPTSIGHITDGASKTLLLSEKRMNIMLLGRMQANDNEGYTTGWNHDVMRFVGRTPLPDFSHVMSPGDDRFGSSHTSGINTALADGSVGFLVYGVDEEIFKAIGVRNDGIPVELP